MSSSAILRRYSHRPLFSLRHLCTQPTPASDSQTSKSTTRRPLALLRSAIKSETNPEKIFSLFQSSTHLHRFHSDRPLYTLTLQKLTRLRRPDLISQLLDSQTSDPLAPKTEGFLTRIITLYSDSNLLEEAHKLFDKIPNPTQLTLSALLSGYLNHKKYDVVVEKFNVLPEKLGIEVGVVPYNLYLKALCGKGEVGTAREVIEEMRSKKGLVPDIVCYNAVLKGYVEKGDEEGFDEVLKEIVDSGLVPNVFTYNCRIMMFIKKKHVFRAEELLDVMISQNLNPSFVSFHVIIEAYCGEGDVDSSVRIFKRMRVMRRVVGKGAALPNGNTYILLIKSLVEKGDFDYGLEVCKECLIRKFAPPFEVVKGLIEGLVKGDKVKEAKDLAEKMKLVVKGGEAIDAWNKVESSLAL